jgi:hypothetical protein
MSSNGSLKSSGPLPKFGGPPSKSFYVCQICKREIRRVKIREHYGTNVDMDVLKLLHSSRPQHLARLTTDKRAHTEKVQDFFDKNQQLPSDYRNSNFWIKAVAATSSPVRSIMQSFLSGKRSSSNLENPPAKKHTKEQTDRYPEQVEDPSDDLEI